MSAPIMQGRRWEIRQDRDPVRGLTALTLYVLRQDRKMYGHARIPAQALNDRRLLATLIRGMRVFLSRQSKGTVVQIRDYVAGSP